jgi:hypothetical protein
LAASNLGGRAYWSGVMLAAFTTAAQRSMSDLMKAGEFLGAADASAASLAWRGRRQFPAVAARPRSPRGSCVARPLRSGVAAGAITPYQYSITYPGTPDSMNVGTSGIEGDPLLAGDRDNPHLPCARQGRRGRQGSEQHHLLLGTDDVGESCPHPLIGDVRHLDLGFVEEQLGRQMRPAANARRRVMPFSPADRRASLIRSSGRSHR